MKKQASVKTEAAVDELMGSILALRQQDLEMDQILADMEKSYPPTPTDSPYFTQTQGKVDVPISAARRR